MEDKRDVLTPLEDGSGRASPVRDVSEHSTTGRLNFAQEVPEQPLQHKTGRVSSCENVMGSRRVSPATSVADCLQSVRMAEELRFQLRRRREELS